MLSTNTFILYTSRQSFFFYNCQKLLGHVGERAVRGCIRRDASLRISTLGCTRRYHCWTFPVVSPYFRSAAGCFPGVSTLSANFSPRGTSNRNNMTIVTRIPTRQSGTDADISATLSHRRKTLPVEKESHWGDFDGIYIVHFNSNTSGYNPFLDWLWVCLGQILICLYIIQLLVESKFGDSVDKSWVLQ